MPEVREVASQREDPALRSAAGAFSSSGGGLSPPLGGFDDQVLVRTMEEVRFMRLTDGFGVSFAPYVAKGGDDEILTPTFPDSDLGDSDDERDAAVATHLMEAEASISSLKGAIETADPADGEKIEKLKAELFAEFEDSSLSGICPRDPPVRGPYGEAEIWLKPDAQPVSLPQY